MMLSIMPAASYYAVICRPPMTLMRTSEGAG